MDVYTHVYLCVLVWCLYVMGILMTIPIHMCHASIWILLSDHMSGKSAPGNRIQAQMMSFHVELTCHLSDSPHQVKGLKHMGSCIQTYSAPDGAQRGKTLSHVSSYMDRVEFFDISNVRNQSKTFVLPLSGAFCKT